jgi:hypothetical protein
VTEGIRPGVLGMSHHLGRWRLNEELGNRTASALVTIDRQGSGYKVSQVHGAQPYATSDPDSSRIWWTDVGRAPEPHVPGAAGSGERHALLASARHAREGRAGDRYGDIFVTPTRRTRSTRNGSR